MPEKRVLVISQIRQLCGWTNSAAIRILCLSVSFNEAWVVD
jgi:hypothetical protein